MNVLRFSKTLMLVATSGVLTCGAQSIERYPDKPVRVIVPFSPGGGTDLQARVLAAKLSERTTHSFIVDNRAGASGLLGIELATRALPDGYTMVFATAALSINTTRYANRLRFNPVKDLAPITWFSSSPLILVSNAAVPAHSVKELVALAQRSPGAMNAGIGVPGSTGHLAMEMLKQLGHFDAVLVPFKGNGPAMGSLIGGEIDFMFTTSAVAGPQMRAGRVRGLAVTSLEKSAAFPDLPTLAGYYPGFESDNWYGLFFPANTPKPIIDKMNAEIRNAAQSAQVRTYMAQEGLDAVLSTPERLATLLRTDIARYARIVEVVASRLP